MGLWLSFLLAFLCCSSFIKSSYHAYGAHFPTVFSSPFSSYPQFPKFSTDLFSDPERPASLSFSKYAFHTGLRTEDKPASITLFNLSFAFTLDRAAFYETVQFVAALQGLVNRNAPRLYVIYAPPDLSWLEYMKQAGQFLSNTTINIVPTLSELVHLYRSYVRGAVVYDPDINALSLLASTAAGAESLLPACRRTNATQPTIYDQFIASGILQVGRSLNASMFSGKITGSTKGDAYIWAINEFIVTNKSDASNMGYYIDYFWVKAPACCGDSKTDMLMSTLSNHDW